MVSFFFFPFHYSPSCTADFNVEYMMSQTNTIDLLRLKPSARKWIFNLLELKQCKVFEVFKYWDRESVPVVKNSNIERNNLSTSVLRLRPFHFMPLPLVTVVCFISNKFSALIFLDWFGREEWKCGEYWEGGGRREGKRAGIMYRCVLFCSSCFIYLFLIFFSHILATTLVRDTGV